MIVERFEPLFRVRRALERRPVSESALAGEIARVAALLDPGAGDRVAIAVPSRGIDRLAEVVAEVAGVLRGAGAEPFAVPAMGSHGGGTPAGQVAQLRRLGVTEERIGAPLVLPDEMRPVARHDAGGALLLPRSVLGAGGLVLVNRVKLHTLFEGAVQSGLGKMLVFGLGGTEGAEAAHGEARACGGGRADLLPVLERALPRLLAAAPPVVGLGLVEDQAHALSQVEAAAGDDLLGCDRRLLASAIRRHPRPPLPRAALLVVERIGKEISGTGMDPHVIGRSVGRRPGGPEFGAILALRLSRGTRGNAHGIGMADHTVRALADQVDRAATELNGRTSGMPERGRLPRVHDTEEAAVRAALAGAGPGPVLQIGSTLELEEALVGGLGRARLEQEGLEVVGRLEAPFYRGRGSLRHRLR